MASKFKVLALRGNEKVRTAELTHLCKCTRFIQPGEQMVRWNSYDLHLGCAQKWCASNGVEADYEGMSTA